MNVAKNVNCHLDQLVISQFFAVIVLGTRQNLIDLAGKDGGYMMMNGAAMEGAKPENVKTMINFTKEYGKY